MADSNRRKRKASKANEHPELANDLQKLVQKEHNQLTQQSYMDGSSSQSHHKKHYQHQNSRKTNRKQLENVANNRLQLQEVAQVIKRENPCLQQLREKSFLTEERFEALDIHQNTKRAIREGLGYECMSMVQARCIPLGLKGNDIIARAKTGSGKTLSFAIPIVEKCRGSGAKGVLSLVISPTRELAQQISDELKKLIKFDANIAVVAVVGGTNINADMKKLGSACQVLVGTPGRLIHLLQDFPPMCNLLSTLKILVLDEADRLLDQGFRPSLEKILPSLPQQRQTMLYSATINNEVRSIAGIALRSKNPVTVDCVPNSEANSNVQVDQFFAIAEFDVQISLLFELIRSFIASDPEYYKIICFFVTARVTSYMAQLFNFAGVHVLELHSRKSQSYRQRVSNDFSRSTKRILFSSDVSARGLDYPDVTNVIQVGIASDTEQYVHRIGRTGRAGRNGHSLIILLPDERTFVDQLLHANQPIQPFIPDDNKQHIARLLAHRQKSSLAHFAAQRELLMNPALSADPDMDNRLRKALESVANNSELLKAGQQAYSSSLGFYKTQRLLGWNAIQTVQYMNFYAATLGLRLVPDLTPKAVGMLGLKGVPGIFVDRANTGHQRVNRIAY